MRNRPVATAALTAVAALLVAAAPATAQQRPSTDAVVATCAPKPDVPFGPSGGGAAVRVARCALAELRTARRPTRQDARVRRAALAAARLARTLEGGDVAVNRDRVTRRMLERFRCPGAAKGVRLLIGDTASQGMRTARELVASIARNAGFARPAPLLASTTRVAVVQAPGRVYAGGADGAATIAVGGATCAAR